MKLDVRQQVRLPLRRCVELVVSGIQFRLFRAAITVGIIALAVAFLMTMLTESFTAREVAGAIEERVAPREAMLTWVNRLSTGMTENEVNSLLLKAETDPDRAAELRHWGGLDQSEMEELVNVARRRDFYLGFFEEQPEGILREMVGRDRGDQVFRRLSDPERLEEFRLALPRATTQFPTDMDEFNSFLQHYQATAEHRQQIRKGHEQAISQLKEKFPDLRAVEILAEADDDLPDILEPLGFRMSSEQLEQVRREARLSLDVEQLNRLLTVRQVRARLAQRGAAGRIADVTQETLLREVRSKDGASWLISMVEGLLREHRDLVEQRDELSDRVEQLSEQTEEIRESVETLPAEAEQHEHEEAKQRLTQAETDLEAAMLEYDRISEDLRALEAAEPMLRDLDLSAERVSEVARHRLEQRQLADIETAVSQAAVRGGVLGFSTRAMWLIVVSLMVCIVGIANAMLMSVTERFKEIATMKCLGATDGFIMINFILESCFQGLAGGLIGAVLGLVLGLVRSWLNYGTLSLMQLPLVSVLAAAGATIGIGVVLSAMAAVYPARVAARLAPMEAMRIE